jgi:hypothetical protein
MALIRACGWDSSMRLFVTDGLARCWRRQRSRRRDASIGNAAPVSQSMTLDELIASLRQIDGQRDKGKHPPNFHFRSKPFLPFHNGPPDLRRRPVQRGLRAGHRINAEATRGSTGAGEGARHRRARVPTAEARVAAKARTERLRARPAGCLAPRHRLVTAASGCMNIRVCCRPTMRAMPRCGLRAGGWTGSTSWPS